MTIGNFASSMYQAHNTARLGHLASLGLPLDGRHVLEVGSGPGDHTGFYLERGCSVVSIDAREECVAALCARYPKVVARVVDMNFPMLETLGHFDVVHAYGILYHLNRPADAIAAMASVCDSLLLLETCVSHSDVGDVNFVAENVVDSTQAIDGRGCRPTRGWLLNEMKKHFLYVYQTRTQPRHNEFPINWSAPPTGPASRIVLVGSRVALDETVFSSQILERQNS